MKLTKKQVDDLINDYALKLSKKLGLTSEDSILVIKKALEGQETKIDKVEEWANNRFIPNRIEIVKDEYASMCVNALKSVTNVSASDYGSSRQRDLGQMWADMIRGYIGEIAFVKFLKNQWNIDAEIGHERGNLSDFLSLDIHKIKFPGESPRKPNLNVSIKTSKWNGIWLDIPGNQFNHSDIHVFVKIGAGRDHLFAFFKEISIFRDKILKIGQEVGSITQKESDQLYKSLPSFTPIIAYICGFVLKNEEFEPLSYSGYMGRKHYTIDSWNGPISPGDLDKIKKTENVEGKILFSGIGHFSHDQGYLFNAGNLFWEKDDWENIISNI